MSDHQGGLLPYPKCAECGQQSMAICCGWCFRCIERLIAESRYTRSAPVVAQPPAEKWLAIETAPVDDYILVPSGTEYVGKAYWDRDPVDEGGQCWRWQEPYQERVEPAPTHWMPLPAPPSAAPVLPDEKLRATYDAAVRAGLSSTEGRTFEQWEARVSDYGLDDARQALLAETREFVLPDERVEEIRKRQKLRKQIIENWAAGVFNWHDAVEDVDYLLSLLPVLEEKKNARQS